MMDIYVHQLCPRLDVVPIQTGVSKINVGDNKFLASIGIAPIIVVLKANLRAILE